MVTHVAIFQHVRFVAESTVPRDNVGATLLMLTGNRQVQQMIQSSDDPIDAAAVLAVDHRVRFGGEDIAGGDHVGTAEEDHAITIGMGSRLMEDLDGLAVQINLIFLAGVGFGGPCSER